MKVLVTGGTGYLGRAVVSALASRGHDVVVFARSASRSGLPGTAIDGDIRDRAAVERAAAGCDAISHAAALVSIWRRRPADFDDVNLGGLRNVLAAAAAHRTPRLLYTSSFVAIPPRGRAEPLLANDYQRTKVEADRIAGQAVDDGAPLIRVYPGVVYGPGRFTEGNLVGRLIADHLRHRLPGLVGPEQRWSYSYVDDVAAGHCAALERGGVGGRYALGGENAPQRRVFEIVEQLTGRRPPPRIPFPIARLMGAAEELRVTLFGGTPLITRGAVEIFRHDWSLDSGEAIRDLGYTLTPLDRGVKLTLASIEAARS
ncbi:MAG TPA: NAD-dependent epimerase/dehydratase family protein [Vicinamibacterales bacterium]|nr:NAD-dependent epimerase/dehydratase family protein [Vicinamibacterales bacterium]